MKKIAKIAALVAALAIACVGLFACTHDNHEAADITELFSKGYECTMQEYDDSSWAGLFVKDDSYYKVTASMSKAQFEALQGLDIFADDYEQQMRSLLESLTVNSCEDVTGKIPTQKDMEKWVGKTIGDAEGAGLERNGSGFNGENAEFVLSDGVILLDMTVAGTFTDAQYDALTDEDIAKLVITEVAFEGFDWGILE